MFFRSVVGTNDVLTVVVLDFDAIEADSEEVIDISFCILNVFLLLANVNGITTCSFAIVVSTNFHCILFTMNNR